LSHINKTNELLHWLRDLLHDFPRDVKITGTTREKILQKFEYENANGYVDWITLSTSLLFSMHYTVSYAELSKGTFYNKVKMFDYDAANYLNGLEVVHTDYRELELNGEYVKMARERLENSKNDK
jgi:hypothetical protein